LTPLLQNEDIGRNSSQTQGIKREKSIERVCIIALTKDMNIHKTRFEQCYKVKRTKMQQKRKCTRGSKTRNLQRPKKITTRLVESSLGLVLEEEVVVESVVVWEELQESKYR
jgi:hypothetical protein